MLLQFPITQQSKQQRIDKIFDDRSHTKVRLLVRKTQWQTIPNLPIVTVWFYLVHIKTYMLDERLENISQQWLNIGRKWFQPLWKILVSWDDYSQYMEK